MITYVNTVLVSNLASSELWTPSNGHLEPETTDAGKFVFATMDENGGIAVSDVKTPYLNATTAALVDTMKIGLITNKTVTKIDPSTKAASTVPVIKWSAVIKHNAIKSYNNESYASDTEDVVTIDFSSLNDALLTEFAKGGKRIIVRLTFKDTPTRYRKWTESYEYITPVGTLGSDANKLTYKRTLVSNIATMINKEWKRARVVATTDVTTSNTAKLILTAMTYDDDNSVNSINWYNKVRFNANMYYTDPAAEGWESLNKHFPTGASISKVPGKTYVGSAKLVRDRESQAMGYEGILNRGEGTWPIIQPEMQTDLSKHYNTITLEFENEYRAADDIFRKTKQAVEIYAVNNSNIKPVIDAFVIDTNEIAGELSEMVKKSGTLTQGKVATFDSNGKLVASDKDVSDIQ